MCNIADLVSCQPLTLTVYRSVSLLACSRIYLKVAETQSVVKREATIMPSVTV